jgi:23S rRNA G2445 N2-methylase RlmL
VKPEQHVTKLRQLAATARVVAQGAVDHAAKSRRDAEKAMDLAVGFDGDARMLEAEARNWDAIADALESGAITFQDGQLLTEVRSAYADAHNAVAGSTQALTALGGAL